MVGAPFLICLCVLIPWIHAPTLHTVPHNHHKHIIPHLTSPHLTSLHFTSLHFIPFIPLHFTSLHLLHTCKIHQNEFCTRDEVLCCHYCTSQPVWSLENDEKGEWQRDEKGEDQGGGSRGMMRYHSSLQDGGWVEMEIRNRGARKWVRTKPALMSSNFTQ